MEKKKPGSSAHFPKKTGCMPWFFRMSAGIKLNFAFNNSGLNKNKTKIIIKKCQFYIFQGLHLHKRIFPILIINASKWRRSAGNGMSNAKFSSTEAPLN